MAQASFFSWRAAACCSGADNHPPATTAPTAMHQATTDRLMARPPFVRLRYGCGKEMAVFYAVSGTAQQERARGAHGCPVSWPLLPGVWPLWDTFSRGSQGEWTVGETSAPNIGATKPRKSKGLRPAARL